MTENEQIKAVGLIEGWRDIANHRDCIKTDRPCGVKPNYPLYPNPARYELPDYTNSRDAIIPVIDRLLHNGQISLDKFDSLMEEIHGEPCRLIEALTTEPELLCQVLLKLMGKWDYSA